MCPSQSPDLNPFKKCLTELDLRSKKISVSRCVKLVEICPKGLSTKVRAEYFAQCTLQLNFSFVHYSCMCDSSSVTFIPVAGVFVSVHSRYLSTDTQKVVGGVLLGTGLWVTIIMIMRSVLKSLLSWHGWMYERHGSISWTSRAWMVRWEMCIF